MNTMLLVSLALTFMAILIWRNLLNGRWSSASVSLLVFLSLILSGVYYVANRLTGSGIDDSIIYHLSFGMDGAAYEDFELLIALAVTFVVASATASIVTYRSTRTTMAVTRKGVRSLGAMVAILLAFFFNPATGDIVKLYGAPPKADDASHGYYIEHKSVGLTDKKNVVFLYLESVERTYMDENLFPGLMPNLNALEQEALSFTNILEVDGTSWTIAGMVASQCGIPLITPGHGNSMNGLEQYLPGATCLGDVLDAQGYELNYMGGARLEFAGKGNFYNTHSFDRVQGFDELNGIINDPDYSTWWGLYDNTLYDLTARRFNELAKGDDPFGLVMLTLDTHHPTGYTSTVCTDNNVVYQDGSNPILNVVHCADFMAGAFINGIRNSEGFDNTILVVTSDHLAMPNTAWDELLTGTRRNLVMFFGDDIEPRQDSTLGSTLDTGITLLNMMGAELDGFGFGRDLLQKPQNLYDQGVSINGVLGQNYDFLTSLWSFPQFDEGYQANLGTNQLVLSNRTVRVPALFKLDDDLTVTKIYFEHEEEQLLKHVLSMDYDRRFIWVDRCGLNGGLGGDTPPDDNSYCVAAGALGAENLSIITLEDGFETGFDEFAAIFDGLTFSEDLHAQRLNTLSLTKIFGWTEVQQFQPDDTPVGHFAIFSAGYGAGESRIANVDIDKFVRLGRGITIVGLNAGLPPEKLGYQDTCAYGGAYEESVMLESDFQTVIAQNSDTFGAFAIVVGDSGICDIEQDFESMFRGTGLTRWSEIDYRTPYIGIIAGDGQVIEYTGPSETALAIEARDFVTPIKMTFQRQLESLPRVAHSAGGFNGEVYTNSIDALNQNYNRFDLFEIDFSWTSDGELVCIHDWDVSVERTFGIPATGVMTLQVFQDLVAQNPRYKSCTLDTLADWLRGHQDVRIVTDIKDRVTSGLRMITRQYPDLIDRFVPQVYAPEDYFVAQNMGFDDIIWSLSRYGGSDDDVVEWLDNLDLFGLTIWKHQADRGLAERAFAETGVLTWVFTVDKQDRLDRYLDLGAAEIYTNWLLPAPIR